MVIEAINDRNSLYRLAKRTLDPNDLANAHLARNRTHKMIYASKADYIKETLYQYKDDPKKFWRVLNSNLLKGDHLMLLLTPVMMYILMFWILVNISFCRCGKETTFSVQ